MLIRLLSTPLNEKQHILKLENHGVIKYTACKYGIFQTLSKTKWFKDINRRSLKGLDTCFVETVYLVKNCPFTIDVCYEDCDKQHDYGDFYKVGELMFDKDGVRLV